MPVLIDLPQAVLNDQVEIHRRAESIYGSGSSNTADKSIRDRALLPLASFSGMANEDKDFRSQRAAKMKIKQLNKKIWRLTKESKEKADIMKNLGRENSDKKKTLFKLQKDLEKQELDNKYCEELKNSIESEREKIKEKRIESERLWSVVGKLGDVNAELKREAEKSLKRENMLRAEINKVKLALSLRKDASFPELYVSSKAHDWSRKLDIERLALSGHEGIVSKGTSKRRIQAKKTFTDKITRRHEKRMKGKGFSESVKCKWPTGAPANETKKVECTIADQIKRQDLDWVNRKAHMENDQSQCSKTGTSIWGTFQKWNWDLDFPAKKESAIHSGEPNPSLVPLKIIDDRVKFLESTALFEAGVENVDQDEGSA